MFTAEVDQDYYPQTLSKRIMFNAPLIFSTLWTIVKPFLDKNTTEKTHIQSGSGQNLNIAVILKCIFFLSLFCGRAAKM
jgi:hypothetical protein